VTHFVAYKEGRVLETAVDYYAQDDAGNVWYFGEDVSNYENGVEVNKDGTWSAGKDGPPGMIMPAQPKVGDGYRPENIPGLVFEEVTVKATGKTVQGGLGIGSRSARCRGSPTESWTTRSMPCRRPSTTVTRLEPGRLHSVSAMLASTWSCGPGRKPRLTGPASAFGRIRSSSTTRPPMLAPLPGTRSSSEASETKSADERCEAP